MAGGGGSRHDEHPPLLVELVEQSCRRADTHVDVHGCVGGVTVTQTYTDAWFLRPNHFPNGPISTPMGSMDKLIRLIMYDSAGSGSVPVIARSLV